MRTYQQLSLDERYQIQAMVKLRKPPAEIASELGRHRSTIYRELKRNSISVATFPYLAVRATKAAGLRRIDKGVSQRKIQGDLRTLVEKKLELSWSPEQIAGRLRVEQNIRLCAETIYQHVLRDTKNKGILRYCLRGGGYTHHRFKKSKMAARTRERKNWIDERPAGANNRTEFGHWERDCIIGARGSSVLLTIVDRKSRYTLVRRVAKLNVEKVSEATVEALDPFAALTKTITNDNGVEFQRDESLEARVGVPIYFCEPSSPWQRGTVENTNGLIRQYLPKRTNFDDLSPIAANAVEETLNFRPRKTLGYRTPYEVLFNKRVRLTDDELMHFGLAFCQQS